MRWDAHARYIDATGREAGNDSGRFRTKHEAEAWIEEASRSRCAGDTLVWRIDDRWRGRRGPTLHDAVGVTHTMGAAHVFRPMKRTITSG